MRVWNPLILALGFAVLTGGSANAQQIDLNRTRFTDPAVLIQNKAIQEYLDVDEKTREGMLQIPILIRQKSQAAHKEIAEMENGPEKEKKKQEVRRRTMAEGIKELEKKLKPEQVKRLKQLALQTSAFQAFEREDVIEVLKLTAEQKHALHAIGTIGKREMAAAIAGEKPGGGGNLEVMWQKSKPARKKAMQASVYVLTPDQKKLWNELVGEPYDFALDRPGKDQLPPLKDAPPPATADEKTDPRWIAKKIDEWMPTPKEKNFDQIGWHTKLLDATQKARAHNRGVFIFVIDGVLGTGRC